MINRRDNSQHLGKVGRGEEREMGIMKSACWGMGGQKADLGAGRLDGVE